MPRSKPKPKPTIAEEYLPRAAREVRSDIDRLEALMERLPSRDIEELQHRISVDSRVYLAGCALTGLLSNPGLKDAPGDGIAEAAWSWADRVLAQKGAKR